MEPNKDINEHIKSGSKHPQSQISVSAPLKGRYVTIEPITAEHIPLLFVGMEFPQSNSLLDRILGFPYIYKEEDLHNHIFNTLRNNPDLTIFAIKANNDHLGPPSPANVHPHDAVLGICGYKTHPPSRTIRLDDLLYSPRLQHTYAATEAHYLQLCHIWEIQTQQSPYSRAWLTSDASNIKSRKHTERMGYKYEGTFRKHNITRWGNSRDSDCLSMIDDEWALNKKILQRYLAIANFDKDGKQIKSLQEVRDLLTRCSL